MDYEMLLGEVAKKYGIGGSQFFQFENGENRLRILSVYLHHPVATHFIGKKGYMCFGEDEGCLYHGDNTPTDEEGNPKKPSMKFVAYVLNAKEKEPQIQVAKLPWTVIKEVVRLQKDDDYKYDQFPMPYDVKVTYDDKKAGTEMYKVTPARENTEISQEILDELIEKKPLQQMVEEWLAGAKKASRE